MLRRGGGGDAGAPRPVRYEVDRAAWAVPVLARPTTLERLVARIAPGWVARRLAACQGLLNEPPAIRWPQSAFWGRSPRR
jgi:hypothetical protein